MKATESNLLRFLAAEKQFVIPIYQRTYSWTRKQCEQLWDDILYAATHDVSGHFIGSIVYIQNGLYQITSMSRLLVIDGQQRLTTLSLLLLALARSIDRSSKTCTVQSEQINSYLLNRFGKDDERYKLLLTRGDKETFIALVNDQHIPEPASLHVQENFRFFEERIQQCEVSSDTLFQGIGKLLVVDISLDRDHDNPQLIFESLNSTGLDLSQADLIRNYVLMELDIAMQQRLYERYWYPMECLFGEAYADRFDRFMRDYLTLKSPQGTIPNLKDVYTAFKQYRQRIENSIEDIVADIFLYACYYANMTLEQEKDSDIRTALQAINTLEVKVVYPFLLEVYHDYTQNILDKETFLEILRVIECYVFRRAICDIPTNSLNKTFATLCRKIDKTRYLQSLLNEFFSYNSYQRFPSDEEFMARFKTRDIYTMRIRDYIFDTLENHGRKESVHIGEYDGAYSIEHILPQNPKLSQEWRNALGSDWENIQNKYLHTIGNLTLTGYNSELGDRSFIEKREMHGGFRDSPIRLNHNLTSLDGWNSDTIEQRAEEIAQLALRLWAMPLRPIEAASIEPQLAGISST